MTRPLVGMLCAVALAGCDRATKTAQGWETIGTVQHARYELVHGDGAHVWKIDTVTGAVWVCLPGMLPRFATCTAVPTVAADQR